MTKFTLKTTSRCEMVKIDSQVRQALREAGARSGTVTVYCPHTTASITINENADPDVCHDLLADLARVAPMKQGYYRHAEGNSDAHLKAMLVGASAQMLVEDGELVAGTWQSLYFCEFDGPRTRTVCVQFTGLTA